MHRLDLGLYSHPKEFWGNAVRTHVHSKGNIPSTESQRSIEPTKLHQAEKRAQHTTNELFRPHLAFDSGITSGQCVNSNTGMAPDQCVNSNTSMASDQCVNSNTATGMTSDQCVNSNTATGVASDRCVNSNTSMASDRCVNSNTGMASDRCVNSNTGMTSD